MDGHCFDDNVRSLTTGGASRRGITGALAALSLTGALGPRFGLATAYAKKKKHKKKRCAKRGQTPKKKHKKRCCKGLSKDASGRCAKPCDVCQPAGACRYDTVQAAVDDAVPGATLTVCAGVFTETLEIAKNLTLVGMGDGAGPGHTVLDGAGAGTVVVIGDGSSVTLRNLRITGGNTADEGGGISNGGTLTITGCTVSGNTATNNGGGIFNLATLELINSTVSGNTADGFGGGIGNSIATTKLINSTVSGNTASEGGGIDNFEGTLEVIESSVTANFAGSVAGGIRNEDGTVICSGGSTVSDNTVSNPPGPSNCIDVGGGSGCATCAD